MGWHEDPDCDEHERGNRDGTAVHKGPAQQLPQPPPAVAVVSLSGSSSSDGGLSPSQFLSYVSLGFGCTIAIIAIGFIIFLLMR